MIQGMYVNGNLYKLQLKHKVKTGIKYYQELGSGLVWIHPLCCIPTFHGILWEYWVSACVFLNEIKYEYTFIYFKLSI